MKQTINKLLTIAATVVLASTLFGCKNIYSGTSALTEQSTTEAIVEKKYSDKSEAVTPLTVTVVSPVSGVFTAGDDEQDFVFTFNAKLNSSSTAAFSLWSAESAATDTATYVYTDVTSTSGMKVEQDIFDESVMHVYVTITSSMKSYYEVRIDPSKILSLTGQKLDQDGDYAQAEADDDVYAALFSEFSAAAITGLPYDPQATLGTTFGCYGSYVMNDTTGVTNAFTVIITPIIPGTAASAVENDIAKLLTAHMKFQEYNYKDNTWTDMAAPSFTLDKTDDITKIETYKTALTPSTNYSYIRNVVTDVQGLVSSATIYGRTLKYSLDYNLVNDISAGTAAFTYSADSGYLKPTAEKNTLVTLHSVENGRIVYELKDLGATAFTTIITKNATTTLTPFWDRTKFKSTYAGFDASTVNSGTIKVLDETGSQPVEYSILSVSLRSDQTKKYLVIQLKDTSISSASYLSLYANGVKTANAAGYTYNTDDSTFADVSGQYTIGQMCLATKTASIGGWQKIN